MGNASKLKSVTQSTYTYWPSNWIIFTHIDLLIELYNLQSVNNLKITLFSTMILFYCVIIIIIVIWH